MDTEQQHGPLTLDDTVVEEAAKRGAEDGKAAASWVTDGNTDTENYARLMRGIEDGDPEVLDQLPSADFSGQWADGLNLTDLTQEILAAINVEFPLFNSTQAGNDPTTSCCERDAADCDCEGSFEDTVFESYSMAFSQAAQDEVSRVCQYQLAFDED